MTSFVRLDSSASYMGLGNSSTSCAGAKESGFHIPPTLLRCSYIVMFISDLDKINFLGELTLPYKSINAKLRTLPRQFQRDLLQ